MKKPTFNDLYFGLASAEAEVARNPERFLRTYYDRWNLAASIQSQEFFLVIGPKGSGKSAVSEYIRLSLRKKHGEHAVFYRTLNLDEVSPGMNPLSSMRTKDVTAQGAALTDSAWRLFLCLQILDLLSQDHGCSLSSDHQVLKLIDDLRRADLLGQDFPSIFKRVRENKTTISLKGIISHERSSRDSDEISAAHLGEALLRLIVNARSSSHFLLSIDGLDRIISENEAYWLTLAALLRVGDELFRRLLPAEIDIRLLVMCRSDVFRRIRFADADKIAADSSIFVDWGAEQTIPADSPLWDYLASKAEISADQLLAFFPENITVGQRSQRPRPIPSAEYLIQSTRSTPREMTGLMRRIQEEVPPRGYVTPERVRNAVDTFATRDLLSIVTAEATGILHEHLQDHLADILPSLPAASNLTESSMVEAVTAVGLNASLTPELTQFMFMAGLLGNYDPRTGYVQFYHRRNTYKFKRQGPWQLHRGLMYAFNIPFS
ncbi:P-loop ATPase, Sll1717 family [Kribbella sp. NPDC049174]|uniref:P-loop ATPase, Sll1717 family n=1 Tax=Kribbella sp. NPDC049174 TaxID=3364112 RepID=UPI003721E165